MFKKYIKRKEKERKRKNDRNKTKYFLLFYNIIRQYAYKAIS